MIISLDTEVGGRDLHHGVRPFLVTSCGDDGPRSWEWAVNPLTREVQVNPRDVEAIQRLVDDATTIVFHNSKFDQKALSTVGITVPWGKVEDTLVASHVLHSAPPHNLTACADRYLGEKINKFEDGLEKAVKKCRSIVQQARLREKRGKVPIEELSPLRAWKIAEDGMPELPSAKGSGKEGEDGLWRNDYWLPAALYAHDPNHPDYAHYKTVLKVYAECDSVITYSLWRVMQEYLRNRDLWEIYRAKFASTPAAYRMEQRGVTINHTVMTTLHDTYSEEAEYLSEVCVGVAKSIGYDLTLPKGNTNHCLDDFIFGRADTDDNSKRDPKLPRIHATNTLNLPTVKTTDSGAPSFDYDARELYLADLPVGSKPYLFVESFHRRAELDTGLSYLAGYERFLVPTEYDGIKRLHPNFHTVGTSTTRWSHSNPNSANVSERSIVNARSCFCPAPGRECYSMDAANIELRIPAYLADEKELVMVFDRPTEGPYYGSYHLVIFDTLYPDLFAEHGKAVKDLYKMEYSCVKNGNFARQYGCQEQKADATYRVKGAYKKIGQRFPKIDALNKATIERANATGGVVTIPDVSVNPRHGYPIMCRRNKWDRISPTVPFAYFVSGTAGWWLNQAIVRCDNQLEQWRKNGYDCYMILSVHDELVFDAPLDKGDNLPRMRVLRELMEQGGKDIGVPTPCQMERHRESWAVGESVA